MQDKFTRMDTGCNLLLNSRNCERRNKHMKRNGINTRTLQKKNINGFTTSRDEHENDNNHSSAMLFHHYQTMNNLKRETNVDRDTHFQPGSPTPRRDMAELSHIFQLYNVANARKPYSSTTRTSNTTRGKKMSAIRDKCKNNGARDRIHPSLYSTRKIHHPDREHHDNPKITKQHGLYEYGNGNRGQYPIVTNAICYEIAEDDISEITTPETIQSFCIEMA